MARCGIGAVLHTLNPRLFPEQIAWIINHADTHRSSYDITFQPIVEAIKDKVPSVKHWIVLTDAAHKPQSAMNIRGLRGMHRARADQRRAGATSRKIRRAGSATRRARRAIPRACSTRIAPTCCTP